MFLKCLFKYFIILTVVTIYFIPENSNANIYQLVCKNKKNTTVWVYSNKRKQVVLSKINNNNTKINFSMERQTPNSFLSKGALSGYQTDITYDKNTGELAMLQKSLRGSNQFYKCNAPKIIKKE